MGQTKPVLQNSVSGKSRNAQPGIPPENEKSRGGRFLNVCLAVAATAFCGCVALAIYSQTVDLHHTRDEIASLPEPEATILEESDVPLAGFAAQPHESEFDAEMRGINQDYICWLKIDGTEISYPVVRGEDNETYLGVSFYGEDNYFGSIFMDYRCMGDNVPNIIVFGHNSRQGDMFGTLRNYLNEDYLNNHPVVTLVANDRVVEYEVIAARRTNVNDPAYFLDFSEPGSYGDFLERCGMPADAAQVLTLSTCVSGADKDERVIVQGVLR